MRYKAILFDIDGTLVDSNELHVRAWEQAFAEAGYHVDPARIRDQIGKGADMLVPTLIPDADEDMAETLGEAHGRIFKSRYLDQVKPFPRARELMQRVHDAGQQVLLASSASQAELDHYLDLLDVRGIVGATTTIDDVERSKPAPDIFAVALGKLDGLGADDVLVLGDSPYDIESAGKCGIGAVAVRSGGFADEALRQAGAIALYDDVAALLVDHDASPLGR